MLGMIIVGTLTLTGTIFTAWATASNRVRDVDTKVEVLQERESLHYLELSKKLDSIEKKLDEALTPK